MSRLPTVSVVVPAWNRGALITRALDSVAGQGGEVLEVLVVDDGSTDDTAAIARAWGARHPALNLRVIEQANAGANAARNRGAAEARGGALAFLDSDDAWLPAKLERQRAELAASPDIGGVYCGACSVRLDTAVRLPVTPRQYPAGQILDRLLVSDVTAPTSCWLVRRSAFEAVGGFDESLPARQDWDLWIRLAARFRIGVVPAVLVELGEHGGERVRSDPTREIAAQAIIFDKYRSLRAELPRRVSRRAQAALHRRHGRVAFHHQGRRWRAFKLQCLALAQWPFDFDTWAALGGLVLPRGLRQALHVGWNRLFGSTRLAIRSH